MADRWINELSCQISDSCVRQRPSLMRVSLTSNPYASDPPRRLSTPSTANSAAHGSGEAAPAISRPSSGRCRTRTEVMCSEA